MEFVDPARPFALVTGVIREALRASGRKVAVVSGGGPEEKLLVDWLGKAKIPFETPPLSAVRKAEGLLQSLGRSKEDGASDGEAPASPEQAGYPAASTLAGFALARACGGLLLGTANKTFLLLSPVDGDEPCLPLGDLYASEILGLAGAATLPPSLADRPPETIRAVDEALEAYYGEGLGETFAFRHLDSEVRDTVLAALSAARWRWQPRPLIPKLGKTTLGLDLDP